VFNFSGLCITPISGTCILVINFLRSVDTSGSRITRIDGTWVAVVTVLWSCNTSLDVVASFGGTSVSIRANNLSVYAVSGLDIAAVCGTCIVVVTVLCGEFTCSRSWVTFWNVAEICTSTDFRSVDTCSINTFVIGTWVVVVTVNSGKDTSLNWIT
jgi:hypothetical protein